MTDRTMTDRTTHRDMLSSCRAEGRSVPSSSGAARVMLAEGRTGVIAGVSIGAIPAVLLARPSIGHTPLGAALAEVAFARFLPPNQP